MTNKGFFVTFEGVDGSGKTSVIKRVQELLKQKGYETVYTREPGGVNISEEIRDIILNNANTQMDPRTEALLFAASRRQHLIEVIKPALQEKKIVLCDRFIDSSLAYQGYARAIGSAGIETINAFAIEECWPAVTYYVDVKPQDALKRIAKDQGHENNRLDVEDLAFHDKVYQGYEELLKRFPQRLVRIDGYQELEVESQQIVEDLITRLCSKKNS